MRTPAVTLIATVVLLVLLMPPVIAHERKTLGQVRLTIGWWEEPALSGSRNAVEVDVADARGAPIADLGGGSLAVEIAFGDQRITLPLRPSRPPGRFVAWLVPNRPGTYTFRITGKVKNQAIDTTSTCSDATFECVVDVSELQFPAKDPSTSQLADRVTRGLPRAEQAVAMAASARTVALAAIGVAGVALVAAIGLGVRKR
ncbi:MAG: hypothetical protein WBC51_27540 [Vicinamibacterales bacterium]